MCSRDLLEANLIRAPHCFIMSSVFLAAAIITDEWLPLLICVMWALFGVAMHLNALRAAPSFKGGGQWSGKNNAQIGCICPPTSERTCQNPICPRKAMPSAIKRGGEAGV